MTGWIVETFNPQISTVNPYFKLSQNNISGVLPTFCWSVLEINMVGQMSQTDLFSQQETQIILMSPQVTILVSFFSKK